MHARVLITFVAIYTLDFLFTQAQAALYQNYNIADGNPGLLLQYGSQTIEFHFKFCLHVPGECKTGGTISGITCLFSQPPKGTSSFNILIADAK